ncbi:MAG TPA: DnaJ domain-containing protein [Gemmatimonadales bacterium]|nr:DnaJ domain-containing protein [Gemmatimonadales bacterium]
MTGPDIHSDDYYRVLGVDKSASADEIKRAYLALVREYTPERAPEAFKRIREAYETLRDPITRGRYDTRLDPRITQLLNSAAEAMKQQEFAKAEQFYKQALLEVPGLDWVRNLLGVCFLQQRRPLDAIAQYERVLQLPSIDPSMHANLAHAYGMVRRYDDAEREFKIAMQLAGDDGFVYGLALIGMIADRGEVDVALKLSQELINAAPKGGPAAAAYFSKQIELALASNRRPAVPAILQRMTRGFETPEEKRNAAAALGNLSTRLVAGEAFDVAEQVARTGARLQPEDPGFDALEQVGRLLNVHDYDGVARVLRTHVSFAPGGAVQGLKAWIEHYVATHAAYKGMRQLSMPPSFFRLYGVGTTLLDNDHDYDEHTKTHVASQYFTVFFVPLFPVANYRVRATPTMRYFVGRVPLRRAQRIHVGVVAAALALLVIWALVSGSSDSPSASTGAVERSSAAQPANPVDPAHVNRYDGEVANTTMAVTPVRAALRFTFVDSSPTGYLAVFPPLTGSGIYTIQARGDEIRLSEAAGPDTIYFQGTRQGEQVIAGTFRLEGPMMIKHYGTWRMHLVSGTAIPRELNPW